MFNIADLPEWFRGMPAGKAALREHAEQRYRDRQGPVDRLQALLASLPQVLESHDSKIAPLAKADDLAQAKARATADAVAAARAARASEKHDLESQIRKITNDLIRGADPRIDEARHGVWTRYERERHGIGQYDPRPTGAISSNTLRPVTRPYSNHAAIQRLLTTMQIAGAQLDNLKLQNPIDLDAAIAGILQPVEACWDAITVLEPINGPHAA